MTDASAGEQAGAGLDRLTREELERLRASNAAYRRKFGYPFLFAVRNSTRQQILDALDERLRNAPEREFAGALQQVYRIARFRLGDAVRR
jgi:2-oxo-4-hydroxy-4-carboxy-5-ureidoimidazoline decarboxylase